MTIFGHGCSSGKWSINSACPTENSITPRLSDMIFVEPWLSNEFSRKWSYRLRGIHAADGEAAETSEWGGSERGVQGVGHDRLGLHQHQGPDEHAERGRQEQPRHTSHQAGDRGHAGGGGEDLWRQDQIRKYVCFCLSVRLSLCSSVGPSVCLSDEYTQLLQNDYWSWSWRCWCG